jgi:stage V sporulation protein G
MMMKEIVISEIQITPIKPRDGLVAFASCILNSQFYIGNIGIYTSPSSPDGFRLTYPLNTLVTGKKVHTFHPITPMAGEAIKKEIIGRYIELMAKVNTH